ncbi:RMD1 family protein [Geothrix oryzisoli]|uniref:RMD1 family protein n=1 Tax=Geothrix oryzisoli TaxID=2922721 RepID=UPI001FABCB2A|nr:RMD1 family protein [Geothrix oryzisoli]
MDSSSLAFPNVPLAPAQAVGMQLRAEYFRGQIDFRAFCARHPHYRILSTNPLVLEPEAGVWVYLARFGAAVFWNASPGTVEEVLRDLEALPGTGVRAETARDDLRVHLRADADRVDFSEVWLRDLTLDKLKIVSLALAQSVALDSVEAEVSQAMARFGPVVTALRDEGRLVFGQKDLLRTVGFAMAVRATVLDTLTLFDDPPETWESEALAHLDGALFDQFDLEERLAAVNQKVAYLQDAGGTVLDVLARRKDQRLEWIIIILILVEVVLFVWKEFPLK